MNCGVVRLVWQGNTKILPLPLREGENLRVPLP